jgi:hypothetical protein
MAVDRAARRDLQRQCIRPGARYTDPSYIDPSMTPVDATIQLDATSLDSA